MFASTFARGELVDDARVVQKRLEAAGAKVTRFPPRFLEEGRSAALSREVSNEATTTATLSGRRCRAFVALGSSTTRLTVASGDVKSTWEALALKTRKARTPSDGFVGAAISVDCETREPMTRGIVRMGSTRGAVESMFVELDDPSLLDEALVERALGRSGNASERPPTPPRPAVTERIATLKAKHLAAGATAAISLDMTASDTGAGEFDVRVGAGCHRLGVLSEGNTDIDAEFAIGERTIERDRGEALDASGEICLPNSDRVSIRYSGGPSHGKVHLFEARYDAPPHLPKKESVVTYALTAQAVRRRALPEAPRGATMVTNIGGHGATQIPLVVEPNHCYLAVVAPLRGPLTGLRLSARVGGRVVSDETPGGHESISAVLCSGDDELAKLTVDSAAVSSWWKLFVWTLGDGTP